MEHILNNLITFYSHKINKELSINLIEDTNLIIQKHVQNIEHSVHKIDLTRKSKFVYSTENVMIVVLNMNYLSDLVKISFDSIKINILKAYFLMIIQSNSKITNQLIAKS